MSPFRRSLFTYWPRRNGHGPYLRLARWPYPYWGVHRDLFDRWMWQVDAGTWQVTVGWL